MTSCWKKCLIIVHFGNSSGGSIGSKTVMSVDDSAHRAAAIFDALAPRHSNLIYTCHGGAIEKAEHFEALLGCEPRFDGYVGGSSAERLPVEESVSAAARAFKSVLLKKKNPI